MKTRRYISANGANIDGVAKLYPNTPELTCIQITVDAVKTEYVIHLSPELVKQMAAKLEEQSDWLREMTSKYGHCSQ